MSVNAAVLSELHRIHRQLSDLRSRLERGPRQIKASETNVKKAEDDLAATKELLKRTRMSADQKELQLREREGRVVDLRTKLNGCSTNREYQAIIEQIAADETANSVLSDEILELFEKITEIQGRVAEIQSNREKLDQDLGAVRKRVDESRASLEAEVGRLTQELSVAEAKLPGDFRREYERVVKVRGDEGMAPLDGEYCGGCYHSLTPQMINELMLSKPLICRACGCILYLPDNYGQES